MKHVFIVGSKGIPGNYGGYETFVDKLTEYHQDKRDIKYHVACKSENHEEFSYHNAHCFNIKVPNIGPAQAIYYDVAALNYCCKYIKTNKIQNPIVYILACRIGPFAAHFQKKIHNLGGKVYVNPDGHEWMRAKWSPPVRKYWKISEGMMVKHSDLLICDSKNIEKYIQETYKKYNPQTTYIAYGADIKEIKSESVLTNLENWFSKFAIEKNNYYLVVGRFVPENNYEIIMKGFLASKTNKDLVIITNIEENKFYHNLLNSTHFNEDKRIKFVGTVYDQDLLYLIRENAFAYIHGHSVGGTNPSLLEAMAATNVNLLYDVGFNREVGKENCYYFKDNLAELLSYVESDECNSILNPKENILNNYSWNKIADEYAGLWEDRI